MVFEDFLNPVCRPRYWLDWAHFDVNIGVQFMQVLKFIQLNNTFVNSTLLRYLGLQVDNEHWL